MQGLESLIGRLVRSRVDFVIVGGFAAMAHGSSLLTMDIDICCDFSPRNLRRLHRAVRRLHPVHRMTPKRLPLVLTPGICSEVKNLHLDTDLGQLDCLSSVLGVGDYAAVRRCSVRLRLPAGSCRILSLSALIRAKEAMGRPRDREAVVQLRAIAEKGRKRRRHRAGKG